MHNIREKVAWAIAGALALSVVASLAGVVRGGPLDPPGPPQSTMKTLDDVVPSWSRKLSSVGGCTSERFSCVLDDFGVLDRETGLVWQRFPDNVATHNWAAASMYCIGLVAGERHGWHLPTAEEIGTLTTDVGPIALPTGHPFGVVVPFEMWTSTTMPGNTPADIGMALDGASYFTSSKSSPFSAWCVRGGAGQVDGVN